MSNIDIDYKSFINQTDVRITQPTLRWGLISPEEQRLVRVAHIIAGGTFHYLHHVCQWVNRELSRLTDLEISIERYIKSIAENLDEDEVNQSRENLPQGRDNAKIDVIGGIHDLRRVLQKTA